MSVNSQLAYEQPYCKKYLGRLLFFSLFLCLLAVFGGGGLGALAIFLLLFSRLPCFKTSQLYGIFNGYIFRKPLRLHFLIYNKNESVFSLNTPQVLVTESFNYEQKDTKLVQSKASIDNFYCNKTLHDISSSCEVSTAQLLTAMVQRLRMETG